MIDKVVVEIGGLRLDSFISYEVESALLTPADSFIIKLPSPYALNLLGKTCRVYVNDKLELTGVIDKVKKSVAATSTEMTIAGRDLMGILVDASVPESEWKTHAEITLKAMARKMMAGIPLLAKQKIKIGQASAALKGATTAKKAEENPFGSSESPHVQFEPGTTIFEALSTHAQRKGFIFWFEADGTLMFSQPKTSGTAEFSFTLSKAEPYKNNIKGYQLTQDISAQYEQISVVGQVQGSSFSSVGDHDIKGVAKTKNFPITGKRLAASTDVESSAAAKHQAVWERNKRHAAGWQLQLTAIGHSQKGQNFRANSICKVEIEEEGIKQHLICLSRTFKRSADGGSTTALTFGKPMEGYTVGQ